MRMQIFNVQSKTDSLVYCTNQTKRLMEKPKRKPLSICGKNQENKNENKKNTIHLLLISINTIQCR